MSVSQKPIIQESHFKMGKYFENGNAYLNKMKSLYREHPEYRVSLSLFFTREMCSVPREMSVEEACTELDKAVDTANSLPQFVKDMIVEEYHIVDKDFQKYLSELEQKDDKNKVKVERPSMHENCTCKNTDIKVKVVLPQSQAFHTYPYLNEYLDEHIKKEVTAGSTEVFVDYTDNPEFKVFKDKMISWMEASINDNSYHNTSNIFVPLTFDEPSKIVRITRDDWVKWAVLFKKNKTTAKKQLEKELLSKFNAENIE
jgi:hypothetical protein